MASFASQEVSLTLPILPNMEMTASKTATSLAESMGMSPDKIDEVRMAVVEACINAFEHSRAQDGRVYITFEIVGGKKSPKLQITIEDTGVGFAPEEIEPPRIEDKLKAKRKRGWGIQIIKGLMDEVEITSGAGGTTVVMRKLG
jgi:serine/threonine-protein kinase RsbW